ncbi:hypothetical protein D4764_12G0008070 [Takifugu flavidus]|uniref:Uncharacterized protein n=1 Tax=Takifugu flavidus TaxID=433684 RepID=A0A5C6PGD7_9TELE|nr:hypothetical protein D4764_12G0008070 [Takifugu flavidus]
MHSSIFRCLSGRGGSSHGGSSLSREAQTSLSPADIETYASYELEYVSTMIDSTSINNIRTITHLLLKVHNITTDQEMNKPRKKVEQLSTNMLLLIQAELNQPSAAQHK